MLQQLKPNCSTRYKRTSVSSNELVFKGVSKLTSQLPGIVPVTTLVSYSNHTIRDSVYVRVGALEMPFTHEHCAKTTVFLVRPILDATRGSLVILNGMADYSRKTHRLLELNEQMKHDHIDRWTHPSPYRNCRRPSCRLVASTSLCNPCTLSPWLSASAGKVPEILLLSAPKPK